MEQSFQQLARILGTYRGKAQAALDALELDDWDGFERAMRWKKAAFHNFRALDYILERQKPGYLAEGSWQELWREIETAERDLAAQIEQQQIKLNQQLVRIRSHRQALNKFQSGVKDTAGFQETV